MNDANWHWHRRKYLVYNPIEEGFLFKDSGSAGVYHWGYGLSGNRIFVSTLVISAIEELKNGCHHTIYTSLNNDYRELAKFLSWKIPPVSYVPLYNARPYFLKSIQL